MFADSCFHLVTNLASRVANVDRQVGRGGGGRKIQADSQLKFEYSQVPDKRTPITILYRLAKGCSRDGLSYALHNRVPVSEGSRLSGELVGRQTTFAYRVLVTVLVSLSFLSFKRRSQQEYWLNDLIDELEHADIIDLRGDSVSWSEPACLREPLSAGLLVERSH
jgi:hypothetical protein